MNINLSYEMIGTILLSLRSSETLLEKELSKKKNQNNVKEAILSQQLEEVEEALSLFNEIDYMLHSLIPNEKYFNIDEI